MHYNLSKAPAQVKRTKSYQDYLDEDRGQVPTHFRELGDDPVDDVDITPERYTSRAFYERERAMWDKVWQATCRVEQIPEVGDYQIYEICQRSYLIVRAAKDVIKAYPNVCLHRGRKLRTEPGRARAFTCPYHGFSWNLDGSNAHIPCKEEFPQLEPERFNLPEVQVGIWCGWVFINPDPKAMPLNQYLDPVKQHYEPYLWERSYLSVHVGKLMKGNWKVVQEAFMESFHALTTHPQIMGYFDDIGTQYDVWKDKPHVNRMLSVFGGASPYVRDQLSEQDVYRDIAIRIGKRLRIGDPDHQLQPGESARTRAADAFRDLLEGMIGISLPTVSDAEMIDGWYYNIFPNLMHWGGYGPNLWYRFRPWKDDHEVTLMEVGMIARRREDEPPKPAAAMVFLDFDQPWGSIPQLGDLGPVLDQDVSNIAAVQEGLKVSPFLERVITSRYQECRIRHLHRTLTSYLGS